MSVETSHASAAPASTFGVVAQIEAGVLDVGYVDAGPGDGPAVVLLHGWPYDIHAFAEVVPILVASGRRVIVPHLRGYGSTRFLSNDTPRNGEQAALAVDAVALLDALDVGRAVVAGFDWGARTADIVIDNYRWRLALSEGEPHLLDLEERLAAAPAITVPTITMEGDANGAPHPEPSAYAGKFSGAYAHRTIEGGIGHNLPQEAPQAFADAILEVTELR